MIKRIYEFNPVIYPTRLWVALSSITIDEIDKTFDAICDDGVGVSFKANHKLLGVGVDAKTYIVGHKKQNIIGCLVIISDSVQVKNLSHEADHCADYLFEEIGETERSYLHGEPYAYYQSWVFDCLYNVMTKRL